MQRRDADLDGVQEFFLHNGILQAVVRDDGDAAVIELDSYSLRHNFGDTLAGARSTTTARLALGEHAQAQSGGIASAHDRVRFKHAISPADIEPDTRARALFLDTWAADPAGPGEAPRYQRDPASERHGRGLQGAPCRRAQLQKRISLSDNRLTVRYSFGAALTGRFETQINLAMPSCDGFLGRYVHEGRIPGGFGQPIELASLTTLALEDGVLGGTLEVLCSPPARLIGAAASHRFAVRGRLREDHAGGHAGSVLGGRRRHDRAGRGARGPARVAGAVVQLTSPAAALVRKQPRWLRCDAGIPPKETSPGAIAEPECRRQPRPVHLPARTR